MRGRLALSCCCYLLCASPAFAQNSAADKAMATQLFEDAEKLTASRNYSEACPKYAESQRLEPQLGTLLHLADCQEKAGKTASAWAHFKEALEIAARRGDNREATAKSRAAALEPKLSRLEIAVPANLPADVEIRQDDNVIGRAVWGSPVPVDPGAHVVSAKAPGYKLWKTSVQVAEGGAKVRVSVPQLEAEAAARSTPATSATQASPFAPVAETPPSGSGGSSQQVIGFVIGGVGVVAVGVGVAFLLKRNSKLTERDEIVCPNDICKPEDRVRIRTLEDEARAATTPGLAGTIAGGAAILGGAILVLTAPRSPAATGWNVQPWVGLSSAGATAAVRF